MTYLTLMFMTVSSVLNLPHGVLSAMCYVESKHDVYAYSPQDGHTPSYGVCQIKYETARSIGFKGSRKDLMEPFTNIYYAGTLLQKHIRRYKNIKKAVVAYNVGHYHPQAKKYYKAVLAAVKAGH